MSAGKKCLKKPTYSLQFSSGLDSDVIKKTFRDELSKKNEHFIVFSSFQKND